MDAAVDVVANPLWFVDRCLEAARTTRSREDLGRDDWGVAACIRERVDAGAQIPSLNHTPMHLLRPNTLVRYRGMVQDMQQPQFYAGLYEEQHSMTGAKRVSTGKYKDNLSQAPWTTDLEGADVYTREPLYLIPVPAETEWCKETDGAAFAAPVVDAPESEARQKRRLERDQSDEDEDDEYGYEGTMQMETDATPTKRQRMEESEASSSTMQTREQTAAAVAAAHDFNFPLPDETGRPCLVMMYEEGTAKVNDIVEVVGVYTVEPVATLHDTDALREQADFYEEELAKNVPSSLVPRVHCIYSRVVQHANPLVGQPAELAPALADLRPHVPALRAALISFLSSAVGGDTLTAEYLLLNLVSRVYHRRTSLVLGSLPINILGCPADPIQHGTLARCLRTTISALVPACAALPVTLDLLNNGRLAPHKDYTTNRLMSGVLQLAPGTRLLLDEAALQEGQLSDRGVRAVSALRDVINGQRCTYDFQFHHQEFHTDIPAVILSHGRSMFQVDCHVPLRAERAFSEEPAPPPGIDTQEFLQQARSYLEIMRWMEFRLDEDISRAIEEDYVRLRQEDGGKRLSQEVLHLWLTMARLLAITFGESSLSPARWEYLQSMESARMLRMAALPPPRGSS